ncbi:MAG: SpoIIE family protein phosphatase [Spirochaetota bacterium]
MLSKFISGKMLPYLQSLQEKKILPESVYRRIRENSLAGKINFIILSSAVPMLMLISALFLFLYFQLSRQVDATLVQKMIGARNAYNYYERTTLVYAKMLAENPYIKKELIAETVNVGPILRVANQVAASVYLDQITVYDKKGVVVVRSHNTSEFGGDESKSEHIAKALRKGENTANLVYSSGNLVLQNTVPVYFDSEIVGAVTAGYILGHKFARSLSDLTQAGIFFVLNGRVASGSFLAKPPDADKAIYEEENRDYTLSRSVPVRMQGDKVEHGRFEFRYIPILTQPGSPDISRVGIAVAVKPPFSRLLMFTLFWGTFLLSITIVLFGIILAFKVGHNIAGYASTISTAMSRFAGGQMTERVMQESSDELGSVARGFNQLAEELQRKISEIREANENLEVKVEQRTRDLNQALSDVTLLKEMQEGDYLLMSLLVRPLVVSDCRTTNIAAQFLMQQKKTYSFRGKEGDIGGDFCLLTTLQFSGHKGDWLFFFNGDAMGKSSQGASGALICGVTLHSILGRNARGQEISAEPQHYLYRIYKELNQIFVLFDGSMLMSAAFGLVHSATGTVYYMNCEHPWSILYRNGQAKFIEGDLMLRKLGMIGFDDKPRIRRFELSPGDTLVVGSDGRDDLEIDGTVDSDETRFLRIVEQTRGDIQQVPDQLDRRGRRTDDLSLVAITYG